MSNKELYNPVLKLICGYMMGVWDKKLIIPSASANLITMVNVANGEVEKIFSIEDEEDKEELFLDLEIVGDDLYLIPYRGRYLHRINMRTMIQYTYKDALEIEDQRADCKYENLICDGEKLWMLGCETKKICCFDITSQEVSYMFKYTEPISNWSCTVVKHDDNIYIPSRSSNYLLVIDTYKNRVTIEKIFVNKEMPLFRDIRKKNGEIFLYDYYGSEYRLDLDSYKAEGTGESMRLTCHRSYDVGDTHYVVDRQNRIMVFAGNIVTEINVGYQTKTDKLDIYGTAIDGSHLYIQKRGGYLYDINLENSSVHEIALKYSHFPESIRLKAHNMMRNRSLIEDERCTLEAFLGSL